MLQESGCDLLYYSEVAAEFTRHSRLRSAILNWSLDRLASEYIPARNVRGLRGLRGHIELAAEFTRHSRFHRAI